ncbi:FAD-binding domain-containing protein [Lactarius quietus]|nr:FAD-binding domain-containing protein [Lactarius quietus]
MAPNSSDDFDFSDGRRSQFEEHLDLKMDANGVQPAHLQRNKTERRRLQGLQRSNTATSHVVKPYEPKTFMEKWQHWMINEGGKRIFFFVWIFLHLLVIAFGALNYGLKDNLTNARATFGVTYITARSAALVLHIDNLTFHKATAWSIVFFTGVHIGAHMINFYKIAMADPDATTTGARFVAFLNANFATGPGVTGWIMTTALAKRANFERFWYSHHLFIIFFICWQLHGMFCMIKPDRPPYCSANTIGVFWRYWLVGGLVWIYERILREVRSRHRTYISKVVQHPSNVVEIQIKKEKTTTRAGQYIFICCPEISYFQWHPFTLTSAPEEDYISVHIRVVGDFTREFAKALGCDFDKKTDKSEKDIGGKVVGTSTNPPLNRVLPRLMVDGPFGSASEDFLKYETVLLVGAGIGVTPFASILKSIWYRMNNFNSSKPTRLSKVYFTWNRIEINIYLTAKIKDDDMTNIFVQDKHADTDVGVFFCGPAVLSRQLHQMSNKYSTPNGTRFFFGKNF